MKFVKPAILIFTIPLLAISNAFAQSAYIQRDVMKVAGATTDAQVNALTVAGKQTTYTYLNGMGTPTQQVTYQGSADSKDLIQILQNDQFGGQSTSYLPYVNQNTATGNYSSTALTDQQNYYITNSTPGNLNMVPNDPLPFSQKLFENSPLHRLMAAGDIGLGFQPNIQDNTAHYTSIAYRTNNSTDNVMISPIITGTTFYQQNVLAVTDAKDADGVETLIFKNTMGQTLLKRQVSGQTSEPFYDTYYIYNANGSLAYIIPPKATNYIVQGKFTGITAVPFSNLIYAYTYDQWGRLITRKVPDAGIVSIVYDPMNRPVLVQDGNKAAANVNEWYYIKYDSRNRPISHGVYQDNTNIGQSNMQNYVNNNYGTNFYESRSATSGTWYYTNQCFPLQNLQQLAFAFYDDYDLFQIGSPHYTYKAQGLVGTNGVSVEETPTAYTQGMLTMVLKRSVGSGLGNIWLSSVYFYDKHSNIIQVQTNNHLNFKEFAVTDYRTIAPDFVGKPLQAMVAKVTGTISAPVTNKVLTAYTYDSQNVRIQTISQTYNSQAPVTLANYSYNELGQLVAKNLGQVTSGSIQASISTSTYGPTTLVASGNINLTAGYTVPSGSTLNAFISASPYLQTLDYRYNIRGQLLTVNNSTLSNDGGVTNNDNTDLFGMTYLYDGTDPNLSNASPSYTGRISAVKWMYKYNNAGSTSNERSYIYNYDQLGQLNKALYAERLPGSTSNTAFLKNVDGFDETNITYDDDGNITQLQHNLSTNNGSGGTPLDNLTYSYTDPVNPDRLYQVTDQVTTISAYGFNNTANAPPTSYYQYDADGNLTNDPYKGISLTYNLINKTDIITAPNISNSTINYTYDPSGTVLRKQVYQNGTSQSLMDYLDEFVYVNGSLAYLSMPEGRVVNASGTFKPEYIITDQQGNARFSFQDSGAGTPTIIQENSYYGFGAVMPNSLVPQLPAANMNNNLYNGGAEWQNAFGNLPDYYQSGNRNYDPELGRFISVDPIAEMSESKSVYHYAGNNPIMANDPTGNCDDCGGPGSLADPGINNDPYTNGSGSVDIDGNNGQSGDTGGGGAGDPYTDYTNGSVPSSSTAFGGTYNNAALGITPYTNSSTASYSYTNNDGITSSSSTTITRSGYYITGTVEGLDASTITMSDDDPGTIPNADITGGSAVVADGTITQRGNVDASQGSEGDNWTHTGNNLIGSFGIGWGVKDNALEYLVKSGAELAPTMVNYAKFVKVGSKALFAAQVVVSGYQAVNAWHNSDGNWRTNEGNKWGVTGKAGLDVTMGAIGAFGGPIGWGISGTYFVGDYFGLWGSWGDAPKQ